MLFSLVKNIHYLGRSKTSYISLRTIGINSRQLKNTQFLKPKCSCILQNKNLMNYFFKRPSLEQYKLRDNIPEPYSLIYKNRSDRYLLFAQIITSVSAVGVLIFTLIEEHFFREIKEVTTDTTQSKRNEKLVYITAFIGFCLVIQYVLYKMPIRIYYWPQQRQYIFVFLGKYPSSYKQLRCIVGEVEQLPEKGLSPWKEAKYKIKNQQSIILMQEYFKKPADLFIMMGIQKDPYGDYPERKKIKS